MPRHKRNITIVILLCYLSVNTELSLPSTLHKRGFFYTRNYYIIASMINYYCDFYVTKYSVELHTANQTSKY